MVRALAILGLVLAACGGRADAGSPSTLDSSVPAAPAAGCADVTGAEVVAEDGGTHRFDVTVRPADTGWDKYADAWEVQAPDGTVLGRRVLAHPHVDEQPFTRSLAGVAVPSGMEEVLVAARDSVEGFCGATITVPVPRS